VLAFAQFPLMKLIYIMLAFACIRVCLGFWNDLFRARARKAPAPFSIAVSSMTGAMFDIPNLHPNTSVVELYHKLAELSGTPPSAVKLLNQTEVLHKSWTSPWTSLEDLGLKPGSQLTLVKVAIEQFEAAEMV